MTMEEMLAYDRIINSTSKFFSYFLVYHKVRRQDKLLNELFFVGYSQKCFWRPNKSKVFHLKSKRPQKASVKIYFVAYDPTVTEWDLYYWFTEAQPYPEELIKDDSMTADYAHEPIKGIKEMMEKIMEHSKNTKREIMLQPELSHKLIHGN